MLLHLPITSLSRASAVFALFCTKFRWKRRVGLAAAVHMLHLFYVGLERVWQRRVGLGAQALEAQLPQRPPRHTWLVV